MKTTTRRTFLKTLPGLGAGVLLPSPETGAVAPAAAANGIHEEAYTFDDHESVMECRQRLFSRFAWIPTDLRSLLRITDRIPFKTKRTAWLIWKEAEEGPRLVDYHEFEKLAQYRHLPSRLPDPGFVAWLNAYSPRSATDVAVAMLLYRQHLYGRSAGLDKSSFQPHPRVDACLRPTRGMLLWTSQMCDIIEMAGNGISEDETRQLMVQCVVRNCIKRNPEKSAEFDDRVDPALQSRLAGMHIDGRPLLGIIDERQVFGESIARPDHEAAERLGYGV